MVDQELVEQVTRLSVPQRLELLELISHSLRAELGTRVAQPVSSATTVADLAAIEQLALSLHIDMPADSSLHDLLGVVSSEAIPTSKEGARDFITDYLIEKYS
jgi:hypothetical protein